MRIIDADALYKHKVYAETPEISGDFIPGFVIDKAPTIDAVPVVRCKDCKHRHESEFCECRPEDAFCSDGER